MPSALPVKTFRPTPEEVAAIAEICQLQHLTSDSAAIKWAIREGLDTARRLNGVAKPAGKKSAKKSRPAT